MVIVSTSCFSSLTERKFIFNKSHILPNLHRNKKFKRTEIDLFMTKYLCTDGSLYLKISVPSVIWEDVNVFLHDIIQGILNYLTKPFTFFCTKELADYADFSS